jgi:hypothetical protein
LNPRLVPGGNKNALKLTAPEFGIDSFQRVFSGLEPNEPVGTIFGGGCPRLASSRRIAKHEGCPVERF